MTVLDEKTAELKDIYRAIQYRDTYYKLDLYFPDKNYISSIDGRTYYRRELYPKALDFFGRGKTHRQRLMLAANRTGKTVLAAYELTCHLTGKYPSWWVGKKFDTPQNWWVCGKTHETIAQILKPLLIGDNGQANAGNGMIPRRYLDLDSMVDAKKASTRTTIFRIRHEPTGGFSQVEFKSYDQSRDAFEGTERSIWFDEEPPEDIYAECLTRTATGNNILMITFTPMEGMSSVINTFTNGGDYTEGEKGPGKYVCNQTWDDIPHLTEEAKVELLSSYPEYQRIARSRGIPQLGQGAVFPIDSSTFLIPPREIPSHWKRVAAMDFGYRDPTAILWCAIDPETEIFYITAEHYFKEKPPMFHAQAIKDRNRITGFDIPIVCDPSGGGLNPVEGRKIRDYYEKDYGIVLYSADNSKNAGLMATLEKFNAGKIKVFDTCTNFMEEFRVYQYNKKQEAAGADHLMDCLRYLVMSGFDNATTKAMVDATTNKGQYVEQLETWDIGVSDAWLYR